MDRQDRRTDLKEVELTGAHAGHAFADCGLDGGARYFAVFEYAPFCTAEDSAKRELLLELPLLAGVRGGTVRRVKGATDKDDLGRAIMIG
jgi:hypothetical protein